MRIERIVRYLAFISIVTPIVIIFLLYGFEERTNDELKHHTIPQRAPVVSYHTRKPNDKSEQNRKTATETEKPPNMVDGNTGIVLGSCDEDCLRFKALMASWDSTERPKSVIYILTSVDNRARLENFFNLFDRFFNNRFKYPVIIFHEHNYIPLINHTRTMTTTSMLFFQEVAFEVPSFLKQEQIVENIPCRSRISYRHMCRFQAKLVYELPIMQGLDYYWRMDDDSKLLKPIEYDVFKYMREHDYLYGYMFKHWDAYECTQGLWEATARYISERQIQPTFFDKWEKARIFYNNFEIGAASLWYSKDYQRYIRFIDKLGGIYYSRWGDAPIKGLAVSLFVEESKMHYFEDIGYQHNGLMHNTTSV